MCDTCNVPNNNWKVELGVSGGGIQEYKGEWDIIIEAHTEEHDDGIRKSVNVILLFFINHFVRQSTIRVFEMM